ncbi:MAG: efflux RND transporter periplasmic adaptor subunit [Deltaproteobacteria bacterium]|nr:efflux RND transporter periplasmic adaptor subunit [Deltaproteobacteria bacterium]
MATTITEGAGSYGLPLLALILLASCASPTVEPANTPASTPAGSWSVTAWGERFELFPEVDLLVAGQVAMSHTHVTRLADFSPLGEGKVEIVLKGASGEQVFEAPQADRPGIFAIEMRPSQSGEFDLLFRIRDQHGTEEIRGGRVRVGTVENPGGVLRAPAPRGGSDGGEPLSLLKEQQWKSVFGTTWVQEGNLARSAAGLAKFRPPAGGESAITSPIDGVLQPTASSRSWPFVGLRVEQGAPLFQVIPRTAPERSLMTLEAELATLEAELLLAQTRRARLEELLALEATSQREVDEARSRAETLEVRKGAAARDLEAARSSRGGGPVGSHRGVALKAPFSGEIAAVTATPGATITAGETLARLVQTNPVWIEVSLAPKDAQWIAQGGVRGIVLEDPEVGPVRIEEGLSLVSISPELSPKTGTVAVLLEAAQSKDFTLGSTVPAQVLSAEKQTGIVVPTSALVDDGGVSVVYLQLSGESFVRQRVTVLARRGDRVLLDHLVPGQRLVTRGGDAIRRSSLMSSGSAHGHVH